MEGFNIVRPGYEAFNRYFTGGSEADLAAWLDTYNIDCELHEEPDIPDARIYRGHAGLQRYAEEIRERWEELSLEVHEVLMQGDVVVTIGLHRGRMRRTGIEFSHPHASVSEFSDGKVMRQRVYHDRGEALRAAGIESER